MKPFTPLFSIVLLCFLSLNGQSQTCNPNGNVIIFANYDGGILNINCDVNIPNLKIGVCAFTDCQISISGPFAGNVTEVIYAGSGIDYDNCNLGLTETTISGVPAGITSVLIQPNGVLSDPDGNDIILCGYSCSGIEWQGGCNTSAQIVAYFMSEFGGTLRSYRTQYNCWLGETYYSSSSLCCPPEVVPVSAYFSISDPIVCIGQCITFYDLSSGAPDSWTWDFEGTAAGSISSQFPGDICYTDLGSHLVTLTASNANGTNSYTTSVEVIACGNPGCTYEAATNYDPAATIDNGTCIFGPCTNSCPGDLTLDGFVGVADLLEFISLFGTNCPD
jgi:PKD domain